MIILRLTAAIVIAFAAGKLISKLRLPAIGLAAYRNDTRPACPLTDQRHSP